MLHFLEEHKIHIPEFQQGSKAGTLLAARELLRELQELGLRGPVEFLGLGDGFRLRDS